MPSNLQIPASGSQQGSCGDGDSVFVEQFALASGFENGTFGNSGGGAHTAKSGGGDEQSEQSGSGTRFGRFGRSRVPSEDEETLEDQHQSGKPLGVQSLVISPNSQFKCAGATDSNDSWPATVSDRSSLNELVQQTYFQLHTFTSEEEANRLGMTSFCIIQPSTNSGSIGNEDQLVEE